MNLKIKTSDLKRAYSKRATNGDNPKFTKKPDSLLFNRHEEYEVIPMLEQVLNKLESNLQKDVHLLEDLLLVMPSNIRSREEVYDWLIENAIWQVACA